MRLPEELRVRDDDRIRWGRVGLAAAIVAVALALSGQLLARWGEQEAYHDWDHHLGYVETAATSVARYGELPLWDPYPCGGVPLLAHPQTRVMHPWLALHLVLDSSDAMRLEVLLHLLIGALGMALLVRRAVGARGASGVVAPLVAAVLWSGTTALPLRMAEGHFWILATVYLPLVVWLFELGIERPSRAALAGAVVALMIGEGGISPVSNALLFLALYGGARAVADRSWRPVIALGVLAAVAAALAAPKLLPMLEYMSRRPRFIDSPEAVPASALWSALASRDQSLTRVLGGDSLGWHEVGHYVGVAGLALAAVGLVRGDRRVWILAGVGAVFAVLGFGAFAGWAPWALLHRVPPFSSQNAPTPCWLILVFALCVLAARGTALLLCWIRTPNPRWVAGAAIALVLLVDSMAVGRGVLGPTRCPRLAWPADAPRGKPIVTVQQVPMAAICRGDAPMSGYSALSSAGRAGVAVIDAYEPMCPRTRRALAGREPGLYGLGDRNYRGEAWIDVGRGEVEITARTHTSARLRVEVDGPALVVLNQNYDPGWSATGARVLDHRGRLALGIDAAGAHDVRLLYWPPFFTVGLACALAGLAGIALLWWRDRRRATGLTGAGSSSEDDPGSARSSDLHTRA